MRPLRESVLVHCLYFVCCLWIVPIHLVGEKQDGDNVEKTNVLSKLHSSNETFCGAMSQKAHNNL